MKTDLSEGVKTVQTLADCLATVGHPKRLEIIEYCLKSRSFTEIVTNLELNPASFKFHSQVLIDCGLIRRVERGVYVTTELGKLVFELVKQASAIAAT